MKALQQWLTLFTVITSITQCHSARVLAVFPIPTASHAAVLETITIELAKRGHELLVFTARKTEYNINNLKNYREILLEENKECFNNIFSTLLKGPSIFQLLTLLPEAAQKIVNTTLLNDEIKELISPGSGEEFDLVLIEWLMWDGLNALGYRFKAPVIGIITVPISMFGFSVGLPLSLIDQPNYITGSTGGKTFIQRLKNFIMEFCAVIFHHYSLYRQQDLIDRHFGSDYPHVYDLMKNVSLILTVQNSIMPYPTLTAPNLINIGGIHVIKDSNQLLPVDVEEFLDDAENGVVYFSLGSSMPGTYALTETRKIFTDAFAEVPYRVIWKWENDELPGKSDNILISKWLPQRAILAHPATKVFIYQGGLQSTEEAIASGVPVIGIPIFGDQSYNVNKMVNVGGGIKLDFKSLTKDKLKDAIMEVMSNGLYKKRMIEFRDLVNDRPNDLINNTMWWIEYVIRHKGAHHLRIERASLSFYQAQYFDVVSFCVAILLIYIFISYKIMRLIIGRCCFGRRKNSGKFKQS